MGSIQMCAMPDCVKNNESMAQIKEQIACSEHGDNCAACNESWLKPGILSFLNKLFSLDQSTMFDFKVADVPNLMHCIWNANDPTTMNNAINIWRA
eukprot:9348617-Ditylum_brightwellii.AAC.1